MKHVLLIILITIAQMTGANELHIEAFKAPFYVGKTVMACGILRQVRVTSNQTYLNLDNHYPNQTLTVLIWGSDIPKFTARFGNIEAYTGKRICARGQIKEYKNTLQIQMKNPQFLRIMQ